MIGDYIEEGLCPLRIIDIHEVRKRLEELIDELAPGESFYISVDGEPKAEVIALFEEEIALEMKKKRKRKPG